MRNSEEIKKTIEELRTLMLEYRNSPYFLYNEKANYLTLQNIECAIISAEKGIDRHVPISKSDERFFEGDRFVEETFNLRETNYYYKIYTLYMQLVEYVRKKKYFR